MRVSRAALILFVLCLCLPLASLWPGNALAADYTVLAGPRPRLFIKNKQLDALRGAKHGSIIQNLWLAVKEKADLFAENEIDASEVRQKLRRHAKHLPYVALAYRVTGEKKYLDAAMMHVTLLNNVARALDIKADLDRAHLVEGLSLAYDWLHSAMTDKQRELVRTTLAWHSRILYDCFKLQEQWWTRNFMQNHNYTTAMALTLAGVALEGEDAFATKYLDMSRTNYRKVLDVLSPDGASHEGVNYWSYGTRSILMHFFALEKLGELDVARTCQYLKNGARFRLHVSVPGFERVSNFADSCDVEYYNPGTVLRGLAVLFGDGRAQWLARKIESAREVNNIEWLDVLWEDSAIAPVPPDKRETTAWFENMGLLLSRTSWADDAKWCFFKAGNPQGAHAAAKGLYAGSHIHPDAGTFQLYSGGWVVVDDGYVFKKLSSLQNVLLVDGVGQVGEGQKWLNRGALKRAGAFTTSEFGEVDGGGHLVRSQLEGMYPRHVGLESWKREFLALPDGTIVIHDSIKASGSQRLELRVHFDEEAKPGSSGLSVVSKETVMTVVARKTPGWVFDAYSVDEKKVSDSCGDLAGWYASILGRGSLECFMVFSSDGSTSKAPYLETVNDVSVVCIPDGNNDVRRVEFERMTIKEKEQ